MIDKSKISPKQPQGSFKDIVIMSDIDEMVERNRQRAAKNFTSFSKDNRFREEKTELSMYDKELDKKLEEKQNKFEFNRRIELLQDEKLINEKKSRMSKQYNEIDEKIRESKINRLERLEKLENHVYTREEPVYPGPGEYYINGSSYDQDIDVLILLKFRMKTPIEPLNKRRNILIT